MEFILMTLEQQQYSLRLVIWSDICLKNPFPVGKTDSSSRCNWSAMTLRMVIPFAISVDTATKKFGCLAKDDKKIRVLGPDRDKIRCSPRMHISTTRILVIKLELSSHKNKDQSALDADEDPWITKIIYNKNLRKFDTESTANFLGQRKKITINLYLLLLRLCWDHNMCNCS
ncbi:hypothetical protein NPIL_42141 [Nephila pilipes]|uniref:Uncharacterized protein n=1 Tax=Nephila pilipes TaxID=299642 RepID=A0A8X6TYL9_NEPPI|nr:hypothetical protein NPIL_42141 [Nephila pilipes]